MSRTIAGPAIGGVGDGRWVTIGEHEMYLVLHALPKMRVTDYSQPIMGSVDNMKRSYYRREECVVDGITLTLFVEENLKLIDAVRLLMLGYHPVTSFVEVAA